MNGYYISLIFTEYFLNTFVKDNLVKTFIEKIQKLQRQSVLWNSMLKMLFYDWNFPFAFNRPFLSLV